MNYKIKDITASKKKKKRYVDIATYYLLKVSKNCIRLNRIANIWVQIKKVSIHVHIFFFALIDVDID